MVQLYVQVVRARGEQRVVGVVVDPSESFD